MKNAFIAISSPFPVEHRPIYVWPALQWPAMPATNTRFCERLAGAIDHVLGLHQNERGIVHAVSYDRAQLISAVSGNPRLIIHGPSANDFETALAAYLVEPGAVLISPRVLEGLDLYGDRGQFVVFPKLPFLNLGDPRTKERTRTDPDWYVVQTAMNIVQGVGRCVRSASDIAPTYILDAAWVWWYGANQKLFPQYFRDALKSYRPGTQK